MGVTNQFIHYLGNHNFKTLDNTSASPASANLSSVLYGTDYEYKSTTKKWIDVGFGDTAESADDYKLDVPNVTAQLVPLASSLTCVSQSSETKNSEDIFACSAVFKNETEEDLVVKEIGLCSGNMQSSLSSFSDCVLLFRTVLSAPVTIAAGESYTFTLHVKLNA